MNERPEWPVDEIIQFTNHDTRGICLALGAIFELLLQMADTLDAMERGQ